MYKSKQICTKNKKMTKLIGKSTEMEDFKYNSPK